MLLLLSRERSANEYIYPHHKLYDTAFDLPDPWKTYESYTSDSKLFMQRTYVPLHGCIFCETSVFSSFRFVQNRTLFISLAIYNILLSFYGRSETYVPEKADTARRPSKAGVEAVKACGLSSADIKQIREETKKTRKELGHDCCAACSKFDFQVPDAGRFKVCAKCNAIGRTVRYCSRYISTLLRIVPGHA
jgi:hypothetical protein